MLDLERKASLVQRTVDANEEADGYPATPKARKPLKQGGATRPKPFSQGSASLRVTSFEDQCESMEHVSFDGILNRMS